GQRNSSVGAGWMMDVFDRIPTEKELVSQSKELCRDFIHSRILRKGLSWWNTSLSLSAYLNCFAGDELECMRPYVYRNIASRKCLRCKMDSSIAFKFCSWNCFYFQGITWGKVVAIYTIAAGLAVDCVHQGHPVMVHTIVDSLGEFVRRNLVPWLKKRGGWGDILKCVVNMDSRARAHWLSRAVFTWRQFLKTIYIYLTK
uniref:BCL2 family apoptosis regulator BOK b n=1 Tax=Sinocyclocheilus grahami TaxID=75366 RepID=A0A672SPL7_SINGR